MRRAKARARLSSRSTDLRVMAGRANLAESEGSDAAFNRKKLHRLFTVCMVKLKQCLKASIMMPMMKVGRIGEEEFERTR